MESTLDELTRKLRIDFSKGFTREGMSLINLTALERLVAAAAYSSALLKASLDRFPANSQEEVRKVIAECEAVRSDSRIVLWLRNMDMNRESHEQIKRTVKQALTAVAHAGNIFNNACVFMDQDTRNLFQEARDICDGVIKHQIVFE